MAFQKIEIPPAAFMSDKELRKAIHKYGKRAQSRLRTLEKAYNTKGGKLYGRKSYVLDRFGDFNTVVKGKSRKALELQLQNALEILNAKSSTVKGVLAIDKERFESFRKNHPGIDDSGSKKQNQDKYVKAMKILGRIQAAERGTKYDSDEQVFMAYQLADQPENVVDDYLDQLWNGDLSSDDFFESFDVAETADYMPIYDDFVDEEGD